MTTIVTTTLNNEVTNEFEFDGEMWFADASPKPKGKIKAQPADNFGWLLEHQKTVTLVLRDRFGKGAQVAYGWFDNHDAINATLLQYRDDAKYHMHVLVNEIDPAHDDVNAQAHNKIVFLSGSRPAISNAMMKRRTFINLDSDPVRTKGFEKVMANETERLAAIAHGERMAAWLVAIGCPPPTLVSTGNGCNTWLCVDLPVDSDSDKLVNSILAAMDACFHDDSVKLDITMGDRAQLARCPASINRKGDRNDVEGGRPWHEAEVLSLGRVVPTPPEILQRIAAIAPQPEKVGKGNVTQKFDWADWLKDNGKSPVLAMLADPRTKPSSDGKSYQLYVFDNLCPFDPKHDNKSAFISVFPGMTPTFKCHHNGCHGKDFADLRDLVEGATWRDADKYTHGRETKTSSAVNRLLKASDKPILFRDEQDTAWADVQLNGYLTTLEIEKRGFADYIGTRAPDLSETDIKEVVAKMARRARIGGDRDEVYMRIADCEGAAYLDLGTDTREVVRITAEGWSIIPYVECPVRFRRSRLMQPLPTPVRGGKIDDIWQFCRIRESQRPLLLAWMAFVLAHPRRPHLHLYLSGTKGTGKSTVARMVAALLDPGDVGGEFPKKPDELLALVANRTVLVFDNVSKVSQAQSDILCGMSTGVALATRTLYTNAEVTSVHALRPCVLTGISDAFRAPDLLDRILFVDLIGGERHMQESRLYALFNPLRGAFLGLLLDAVVAGLRSEMTEDPNAPNFRMADFRDFGRGAVVALGETVERFYQALIEGGEHAHDVVVESSPVFTVLFDFARKQKEWIGDTTGLFKALTEVPRGKYFPAGANGLASNIRRLKDDLAKEGVTWTEVPRRTGKTKRQQHVLRYDGPDPEPAAPVDHQTEARSDGELPF